LYLWRETFDIQEDQENYPRLSEFGSRTASSGYWTADYYYFDMPSSFWGDYKWASGASHGFISDVYSYIYGWSIRGDEIAPGATNEFEFTQIGSKLNLDFYRTTYAPYCAAGLFWGFHLLTNGIELGAPSTMKWEGLSLEGDDYQCAVYIYLEFQVKKLISTDPIQYQTSVANKKLMFFTTQNYSFNTPKYTELPDGSIVFQRTYLVWYDFPPKRHSVSYLSNAIKLVDEINYQWNEDYGIIGIDEEIGGEYISKITVKNIELEFLNTAYSKTSAVYEETHFSIDGIRFNYFLPQKVQ